MNERPSPKSLFLQITNLCNLNCTFCSEGEGSINSPKNMSMKSIMRLVSDFSSLNGERVVLTGGEPSLHPDLSEIISTILSSGLKAKVDTNGTILFKNFDNISRPADVSIRTSLEGDQDQNDRIRGSGVFEKVVANLRTYSKEGFDCGIKLTLVPTTQPKDIETLALISSELELPKLQLGIVKYFGQANEESFKFEVRTFTELLDHVPKIQKTVGVKIELCDYVPFLPSLKDHYAKACKGINNYFVFIDGEVVPCRFLDNIILGNVQRESLITE